MISSNLLNRVALGPWTSFKLIMTQSAGWNQQFHRGFSNNLALVSKIHRESFLKTYPCLVVQPDGSSFYIRYHEPRSIIQLPLDITTLSPEEMKAKLLKRNPKKKVVFAKEEKDNYQPSKYIKLVKKKK